VNPHDGHPQGDERVTDERVTDERVTDERATDERATDEGRMNKRLVWFLLGGLLVALVLAGVVSNFASGSPDGLDSVAREGCTFDEEGNITGGTCMAQQEQEHQLKDGPLADYGISGIDNPYLSTGLAGVIGVLVTFGLGTALFWLVRRRQSRGEPVAGGR
jgi:cobalt/nickel transport protein